MYFLNLHLQNVVKGLIHDTCLINYFFGLIKELDLSKLKEKIKDETLKAILNSYAI